MRSGGINYPSFTACGEGILSGRAADSGSSTPCGGDLCGTINSCTVGTDISVVTDASPLEWARYWINFQELQ